MQADFFDLLSDEQTMLANVPARLPTGSWIGDFLVCEGVATLQWPEPDPYLQSIFDFGKDVHEATALRYLGLEPVLEPGSRVDTESRAAVPLIPELIPISEAGAVEVPFELLDA